MISPADARTWLRQRDAGALAVQAIEDAELRDLDQAVALAQADALLAAVSIEAITDDRRTSSGFVEQQRLFMRARR